MVAKINSGSSIAGALAYNEVKVKENKAEILQAGNMPPGVEDKSLDVKDAYFKIFTDKNPNVSVNTIHMNVNFSEKDIISNEQMQKIAGKVIEAIGLEKQPYLIYRHHDAGHPHMHIVTTNVTYEGKRISDSNNAYKLRSICEDTENMYGFTKTGKNIKEQNQNINQPNNNIVKAIQYPDPELRRNISDAVNKVVTEEKFDSLESLSEKLKLYNIKAIGIKNPDGQREGIMFTALKNGRAIGAPIRSSDLLYDPKGFAKRVYQKIEDTIQQNSIKSTLNDFIKDKFLYEKNELVKHLKQSGITYSEANGDSNFITEKNSKTYSLRDIASQELIENLTNRKASVSITFQESKELTKAILLNYKLFQKKHTEKYPFESKLIQDITYLNFKPFTEQQLQDFEQNKRDAVYKNFMQYKSNNTKEIFSKDKQTFTENAVRNIEYIAHLNKDSIYKLSDELGIKIKQTPQGYQVSSKEYPEIFTDVPTELKTRENNKVSKDYQKQDGTIINYYSQKERKNQPEFKNLIKTLSKQPHQVYDVQYLKAEDKIDFYKKINTEMISQISLKENGKEEIMRTLKERGIIVKPEDDGSYKAGFHTYHDETFSEVNTNLSSSLLKASYTEKDYHQIKSELSRQESIPRWKAEQYDESQTDNKGKGRKQDYGDGDYGDISENQIRKKKRRPRF